MLLAIIVREGLKYYWRMLWPTAKKGVDMDYKRFLRDEHSSTVGQVFTTDGRKYRLEGKAGDGAIGIVRKARELGTLQQVAVKFLAPELKYIEESSLHDIHTRFRREGMRGVSLTHDNLAKIISYEENEGSSSFEEGDGPCNPFIVMEYVQGKTLESFIKSQQPKSSFNVTSQTLHIAHAVTSALVYLHNQGIVHRDVKPANIYLSRVVGKGKPSVVKLGDFGVVKWGDFKASLNTGTLTLSGQQGLGTFKYMSPEQATKPKDVGVKSDMYSLGISLYELFTNQVLPSHHHVYQLTQLRLQRNTTTMGRLYELGLGQVPDQFEDLFSSIFDMSLIGPTGRPSSKQIRGKLDYLIGQQSEASRPFHLL